MNKHELNELKYNDVLVVTKGKHKGRLGFYDNDEDDKLVVILFKCEDLECEIIYKKRESLLKIKNNMDLFCVANQTAYLEQLRDRL